MHPDFQLPAARRLTVAALALAVAAAFPAHADSTSGFIAPATFRFDNGVEVQGTGNVVYDYNGFSGEAYNGATFKDDDAFRRQEAGVTVRRKGVFDATVNYDFEADVWQDVYLRLDTKPWFGTDLGKLRIGQSKTPVGFEGVTANRAGSFMEQSLPTQAFYAGRRIGLDWALERPRYLVNAGYYAGGDLQGNNAGDTVAARAAWTPFKGEGDVLHLGASASVEHPDSEVNGRGVTVLPSARLRARPEAGLTPIRLVDSGALADVDRIERVGLEGLWIDGPWSVQGEYLRQSTEHAQGRFDGEGYYLFGSWLATGESRRYSGGNVANPVPAHDYGAVELLLRYSHIDLNDGGIAGGRERDWTFGANWYLTPYLKFQANYVKVDADRAGQSASPDIVELRAQVQF